MSPNPKDTRKYNSTPQQNEPIDFLYSRKVFGFLKQFKQFGWDLLGILFILVGFVSLLGYFGLSKGVLITPWISLIRTAFGWSCIFIILTIMLLGLACFSISTGKKFPLKISQVLFLEGAYLCFIALLSYFGGNSIERAQLGKDGGTFGWGLAGILPNALGVLLYLFLFVVLLSAATGWLKKWVTKVLSWGEAGGSNATIEPQRQVIQQAEPIREPRVQPRPQTQPVMQKTSMRDDRLPPLNLLMNEQAYVPDQNQIRSKALTIEKTLAEFGLPVRVIGFRVGPTVTQFALEPGYISKAGPGGEEVKQKVKVAQISALSRDLTLALSASTLRIETPVPGRSYVGIEVPNSDAAAVRLRSILESNDFKEKKSPLSIGIGKNVSGEVVAADLEKMPHLLIAGTTNSGKSVCITALTTCLIMNNTPHDLRLVMLDPKRVELMRFNGLPHLLGNVETEIPRMAAVLRWAQIEMDARYRLLSEAKVRNLEGYNKKMMQKKLPTLPRIVILIDELADLMLSSPEMTEQGLTRLAQMARATGMHLVVATQRPSTDVVTGVIKANFPARISFAVASSVDSRVILDTTGAENLLGKGDMLFLDPTKAGLQRLQGVFVNDSEIEKVITHWQHIVSDEYDEEAPWESLIEDAENTSSEDPLMERAISVVRAAGKASTSLLQRRLGIGFPRARRLMDDLEANGIVGPAVGSGKDRDVLVGPDEDEEDFEEDID